MTGDIVITLTIKPLKGGKRPVIVSAAPLGEMPLILTGFFQDRIALLDAAYQQMLTRKPKVVKVAGEKSQSKKSQGDEKSQTPPKGEAFDEDPEETVDAPAPVRTCRVCGCTDAQACEGGCTWIDDDLCSNCEGKEKPDQLVRQEALPEIEGDDPHRISGCTCGETPCICPF